MTLELAVLDTHALLWWLNDEMHRFGRRSRAFLNRVDEGDAVVCIPTLVLVEVGEAIRRGSFRLSEPLDTFVARVESTPSRYVVAPFTAAMALRAHDLYAIPERGDRLIAATALELGYPLVTRDPEIVAVIGGEHVW